jgi:hypothetical protein
MVVVAIIGLVMGGVAVAAWKAYIWAQKRQALRETRKVPIDWRIQKTI